MALDIWTLPFSPFQPSPPSQSSPDNITTPRASFYITSRCIPPSSSTRPSSSCSVDSGYASTVGPQPDLDSMPKNRLGERRLSPPNSDAYASEESPKPKRALFQRRKISLDGTSFSRTSWHMNKVHKDDVDVPSADEDDRDHNLQGVHSPATAFEAKHHFTTRRGMIHHPYPPDQVPYMQAYDRTLLDNDRFSDILLQRLSTNGSPSFLSLNGNPPSAILDLGCGAGHWAIRAAKHWPRARIIGIDLVSPLRLHDGITTPPNVEWRQMNFIGHRLGFPSDTFDLVRMANLSLCIPLESWDDVLSEVKRVLAPGGRLELIDDRVFFPTTKSLDHPSVVPDVSDVVPIGPSHGNPYLELDDDRDEDETDDDFKSTRSRASSIRSDVEEVASYDAASEQSKNDTHAKALEGLFADMLQNKYNIHTDPRGTIEESLDTVFGRYNSQRVAAMSLAVAPPVPSSDSESDRASVYSADGKGLKKKKGEVFKQWINVGDKIETKGKKGDRSSRESILSPIPEAISPKAAGRLGISHSTAPSPSSSPRSPRSPRYSITPLSRPTQSPGLILWPSTLIELGPFELEMHACKHMHSLLGCKAALYEYAEQLYRDVDGKPLMDDAMFDDLIWDYECFRRKRFNWPSTSSETEHYALDEPIITPSFRHSTDLTIRSRPRGESDTSVKQSDSSRYSQDELTFVRSIYVYSASKTTVEDLILS